MSRVYPNTGSTLTHFLPEALLVQGNVAMGLCSAWPLRSGFPKASGQRLWWGPGTATILRVSPLQSLPWIQV